MKKLILIMAILSGCNKDFNELEYYRREACHYECSEKETDDWKKYKVCMYGCLIKKLEEEKKLSGTKDI